MAGMVSLFAWSPPLNTQKQACLCSLHPPPRNTCLAAHTQPKPEKLTLQQICSLGGHASLMPGLYSEKLPQGKGIPGFETGRKSPQVLGREQQLASLGFSVVFLFGSNSRKGAQLKVLPGLLTGRMAPQVKACVCAAGHRRATAEAARGARSIPARQHGRPGCRLFVSACNDGWLHVLACAYLATAGGFAHRRRLGAGRVKLLVVGADKCCASCCDGLCVAACCGLTAAAVHCGSRVVVLGWVKFPVCWACKLDARLADGLHVSTGGSLQDSSSRQGSGSLVGGSVSQHTTLGAVQSSQLHAQKMVVGRTWQKPPACAAAVDLVCMRRCVWPCCSPCSSSLAWVDRSGCELGQTLCAQGRQTARQPC